MAEYNKIRLKILNIYKYLILNYRSLDANQINDLYIEYLKLSVQMGTNQPLYSKDFDKYLYCNCYCYALGLTLPSIFRLSYNYITKDEFGHTIGFISKRDYINDANVILENLFADLETLKISVYDSDINSSPKHGGYKISLYLENNGDDFHFIRQNSNGIWSEKEGYNNVIRELEEPKPLDFNYKYIKTFEIVKPIIKSHR